MHLKGALDNILKCSFWLNFIYHVRNDWSFTNTKRKIQKIPSKSEEIINFCCCGDEANSYSCCCLKHGYSKPKCHNLHNVQLIFVSVQRTAQTSFRIFLQTRKMVDSVKFNSHDSGGYF